jgi:hypothetical protein
VSPPEHTTQLYFEAHVTVDPVFDGRLLQMKAIVKPYQFRVADLLMKKRAQDTAERSKEDTFCTGRGKNYADVKDRTTRLVSALKTFGFKVRRWKIENTLDDVRLR